MGSGAAGCFKQSKDALLSAMEGVGHLAPSVLGARAKIICSDITEHLVKKPLTLLNLSASGCSISGFFLQAAKPNTQVSPGLPEGQDALVRLYARDCAQLITQSSKL